MNDQETRECLVLIDTLERTHPGLASALFHIANEGKRTYQAGKKLKRMGMKAGVTDYQLPVARCGYSSLFLEYKTLIPRGYPSNCQKRWQALMNSLGNLAVTVYGVEHALEVLTNYWYGQTDALEELDL